MISSLHILYLFSYPLNPKIFEPLYYPLNLEILKPNHFYQVMDRHDQGLHVILIALYLIIEEFKVFIHFLLANYRVKLYSLNVPYTKWTIQPKQLENYCILFGSSKNDPFTSHSSVFSLPLQWKFNALIAVKRQ